MEAVAARAGVSRPTIYRRWPSRAGLLFEAQTNASVAVDFPDTGSSRGDFVLAVRHLADSIAATNRALASEQIGAMIADAAFARRVWEQRWGPDRDVVLLLWARCVERGDIDPSVDGAAVIDDLVGTCMFRVMVGHQTMTDTDVESLVDRVFDGVRAPRP